MKKVSSNKKTLRASRLERWAPWILTVGGGIGVLASLGLSIEEFKHLKNPSAPLGCDINPIIGCGSILDTWQGHALLGIPNQFLGAIAFTVIATIGVSLLAGAHYKKWFWQLVHLSLLAGVIFVHWFIFQSLFVLKHLCPFCMATWVTTIVTFWYILLYGLRKEHLRLHGSLARLVKFAQKYHLEIAVSWLLLIIIAIAWRFWYYWQTLI
ncbi:MAG: hypothetical protein QG629_260 [Patescibacteria group bacterium]|nr:vitamin K epoxide reductase family protein [Candidatus Saccharibacteria bacterium]MDQ5963178.1 hypothetical protein [Patescibacteria group bacterium]